MLRTPTWLKNIFTTGYKPTQSDFADVFDTSIPTVKSFANADLDENFDLSIATASFNAFNLVIQKPDGTHMLTAGLAEKVSQNQIKVHFGESIEAGTWYYILYLYIA